VSPTQDILKNARVGTNLYEGTDDSERCKSEILERPGLGCGVEERIQEERDMRVEEQLPRLAMTRNTLQQRQRIAHAIAHMCRKTRRTERRIHRNDFLEQYGHDAERVPQHQREVVELFALLAEFEKGAFAEGRIVQV